MRISQTKLFPCFFGGMLVGFLLSGQPALAQVPNYSQPLSREQVTTMQPNVFVPLSLPLQQNSDLTLEVQLPHFRLFRPEPIPVTAILTGKKLRPEEVELQAELSDSQRTYAQFSLKLVAQHQQKLIFQGTYTPTVMEGWNSELYAQVQVKLKGKTQGSATAVFQYLEPAATLTGKGKEHLEGPHLLIPLKFQVQQRGRYEVTAHLYQTNGQPVARLMRVADLKQPESELVLMVHASVLRQAQAAGPYRLQDFMIERYPEERGQEKQFGNAPLDSLEIMGFPLEQYSDEPPPPEALPRKKKVGF